METLIVTNNKLTEFSLSALNTFGMLHKESNLSHVYLGSNRISREHSAPLVKSLGELEL